MSELNELNLIKLAWIGPIKWCWIGRLLHCSSFYINIVVFRKIVEEVIVIGYINCNWIWKRYLDVVNYLPKSWVFLAIDVDEVYWTIEILNVFWVHLEEWGEISHNVACRIKHYLALFTPTWKSFNNWEITYFWITLPFRQPFFQSACHSNFELMQNKIHK